MIDMFLMLIGPSQDDVVEEQNERLAQELAGKVSRLKSVCLCYVFDFHENLILVYKKVVS